MHTEEKNEQNIRQQEAVHRLHECCTEENLWRCIAEFQNTRMWTASGLPFQYKLKVGRNGRFTKELWVDRREDSKSLAWSSVLLAFGNIKGEVVDRPKALGDIRGVTYIYGMFYRFGLIDVSDEVKAKMGHPKNHKKKRNLIDGSEHILYDRLKKDEK